MQFPRVLGLAMVAVMFTYVVLGQLCLLSFGNIDNGSITAFLQQKYGGPFAAAEEGADHDGGQRARGVRSGDGEQESIVALVAGAGARSINVFGGSPCVCDKRLVVASFSCALALTRGVRSWVRLCG